MSTTSSLSPIPPEKRGCHRTGFEKTCRTLVVDGVCNRWIPESGQINGVDVIAYDCADNWQLQYLKDNAQAQNGTGAAIESFRNEIMAANGFPNGHPAALPVGAPLRALPPKGDGE